MRETPVLRAKGLSIGWSRGRVRSILASGISLELLPGEFASLIGPNGAGKSTLLRSLAGFQRPLSGEVELCGDPVTAIPVEERARRAACVFTGRIDSGWFTVFDIVAFGRYPFTDARNRLSGRDHAAVADAIESVGLEDLSARRFSELSDGERQKALIARAIAQDCPLLVLDEPTAFLDALARIEIFHLVLRLAREGGKAVVLSTHDLDLALRYADRLWLLDRDHRFEAGVPEALAMSGGIARAFDGPQLRFDSGSGTFRATEAAQSLRVSVEGEDPEAAWTERLVARLGFELVPPAPPDAAQPDPRPPDAAISIRRRASSIEWALRTGGGDRSFDAIEGLAEALRFLRAKGRARVQPNL